MKNGKRKRKLISTAPDAVETVEQPVAVEQRVPQVIGPEIASYALGPSCTMREGAAMKTDLLKLLNAEQPVELNVGAVERIDTSALQLLCAFVHDRRTRGRTTQWAGHAAAFAEAVEILGLTQALSYVSGSRA